MFWKHLPSQMSHLFRCSSKAPEACASMWNISRFADPSMRSVFRIGRNALLHFYRDVGVVDSSVFLQILYIYSS
ncbi:hypothetical protein B9Z55_024500 [Caenorhabditis nigoni]|uniref:Uncharacterized protein n=1 Tax=Caenorhabditis nigoni TaxID=1611254 RepID=A0A2G5SUU4_9PELO|nr:hypothetical protein B9Z55_024500 [Caenorhabditis nigoni]